MSVQTAGFGPRITASIQCSRDGPSNHRSQQMSSNDLLKPKPTTRKIRSSHVMNIPALHKAVVLSSFGTPPGLKVEEVATPVATPGSAILKVLATQVYSSGKVFVSGYMRYHVPLPLTPGAGSVCRIVSVGPDCVTLTPGQLVVVDTTVRARDDPTLCMLQGFFAIGAAKKLMEEEFRHGSYAEYLKAPLENIFPIDEEILVKQMGLSIEELVYINTLMVPINGLDDLDIKPGKSIIVAPATGSYGGAAVTAALAMGGRVVAVARNEARLKVMQDILGPVYGGRLSTVKVTGQIEDDAQALLKASPSSKGYDAYLDLSPTRAVNPTHIKSCLMSLKVFGQASFMGGVQGDVDIPYGIIMRNSISLKGRFMYQPKAVRKLIAMVEAGNLKLGKKESGLEILGAYKLEDIGTAIDVAAGNPGFGKLVVLTP